MKLALIYHFVAGTSFVRWQQSPSPEPLIETPPYRPVNKTLLKMGSEDTEMKKLEESGFNGGKMGQFFEFDSDFLYKDEIVSEEASTWKCFFYKIDGSNGMIFVGRDGLTAFRRLDRKGKPMTEGCVALPKGANTYTYRGHTYCYEPITLNVTGKESKKNNHSMVDVVDKHEEHIRSLGTAFVSVERVGTKFNKTPGVPVDVAVAIHSE